MVQIVFCKKISKIEKYHPYEIELVQELSDDSFDRQIEWTFVTKTNILKLIIIKLFQCSTETSREYTVLSNKIFSPYCEFIFFFNRLKRICVFRIVSPTINLS